MFSIEPRDNKLIIILHKDIIHTAIEQHEFLAYEMKITSFFIFIVVLYMSCSRMPVYQEVHYFNNHVQIEILHLPVNEPVFFTIHPHGNSKKVAINFFVLRSATDIQSYFDACARCYPKKMGYRYRDSHIFCRACDISYHIYDLKDGIGSCYPIKLKGYIKDNYYVIELQHVLEGEKYF